MSLNGSEYGIFPLNLVSRLRYQLPCGLLAKYKTRSAREWSEAGQPQTRTTLTSHLLGSMLDWTAQVQLAYRTGWDGSDLAELCNSQLADMIMESTGDTLNCLMVTGAVTTGTFVVRYALSLTSSIPARTSPYSPPAGPGGRLLTMVTVKSEEI